MGCKSTRPLNGSPRSSSPKSPKTNPGSDAAAAPSPKDVPGVPDPEVAPTAAAAAGDTGADASGGPSLPSPQRRGTQWGDRIAVGAGGGGHGED